MRDFTRDSLFKSDIHLLQSDKVVLGNNFILFKWLFNENDPTNYFEVADTSTTILCNGL